MSHRAADTLLSSASSAFCALTTWTKRHSKTVESSFAFTSPPQQQLAPPQRVLQAKTTVVSNLKSRASITNYSNSRLQTMSSGWQYTTRPHAVIHRGIILEPGSIISARSSQRALLSGDLVVRATWTIGDRAFSVAFPSLCVEQTSDRTWTPCIAVPGINLRHLFISVIRGVYDAYDRRLQRAISCLL